MTFEKRPVVLEDISFDTVLNSACERLWNKQTEYSLRRIREMGEELDKLERELEQFMNLPFSTEVASEK
jgi:hypothetical protein